MFIPLNIGSPSDHEGSDEDEDNDEDEDENDNEADKNDEDNEDNEDDTDDEDISTRAGASTNPSAPISQPPSAWRLVDFNIYVNIINDKTPGVLVCVVEVKPFPYDKIIAGMDVAEAIDAAMGEMLPQVIQQVQFALHQFSGLEEMNALLFVGGYCRFLRFKRNKVPELPHLDDIPAKFEFDETEPDNSIERMLAIAEPGTREKTFRIFKGVDYDPAFKRAMNRIVLFASTISMNQQQE